MPKKSNRPLSYESLKSVLLHMEANLRFRLSFKLPGIRTAERATPLRISSLTLSYYNIVVDDIEYSVLAQRKHSSMEVPKPFSWYPVTSRGAICDRSCRFGNYDINFYGGLDWITEDVMTPGDMRMGWLETGLNDRKRKENGKTRGKRDQQLAEDTLEKMIEDARRLPENKTSPEEILKKWYSTTIQFTMKGRTCYKTETLTYDKKLTEAKKYVATRLFGNRRHSIIVRHFYFVEEESEVVRLPSGFLQFKIQSLKTCTKPTAVLNFLEPILDPDSFPLKKISMNSAYSDFEREDFEHSAIHNAKKLIFGRFSTISVLKNLQNEFVAVELGDFTIQNLMDLLNHWIATKRKIGSIFRCSYEREEEITRLFNLLQNRFGVVHHISGDSWDNFSSHNMWIPINETSQLRVFSGIRKTSVSQSWRVYMKVIHI
ncbi:hypothetical protein GCK72_007695 [Caenorhabditis remanei]|uniref:Uncharacterized protein n=1 Tax=Caenorhabditis remanei TaxID=31234 RepID=A0A6A5HM29_CAERE|nr:hypothetical protein GCK72_007695 [Caenorhabditis remanei]KAF1767736.1 hypothetical protein GCK72_007695 [Caenorhabditis remanei]